MPLASVDVRFPDHEIPGADVVLTTEALAFVADLVRAWAPRINELLERRRHVASELDQGATLGWLPETRAIREGAWTGPTIPNDLEDRRVEITGPVDRKMIINALNSGANVFMADFEDATSPTFRNLVEGQRNVFDAVRRNIEHLDPHSGKHYSLSPHTATLMVRPRGLHLIENHVEVDGRPIPASLFDFGLHFFHNARALIDGGSGPYFYLPKLESHEEARLWNDVFVMAEQALRIPVGTIRATVLIETLPAAFQMDEILYELRTHSAGLNCGRWDYIFSFIKKRRNDPRALLPDRGLVTMEQPCMRAYTQLLVKTCHRRGVHAMGGMAAQIPIKGDNAANEAALARVRADKLREVWDGHDGTWVAHPALVPVAREIFDRHMATPNQIRRQRDDVKVEPVDLLEVPAGIRTMAGLRHNIRVGVQYLAAWLAGTGCVPLYNLMEDAATAEISRSQVWQWLHFGASLDDGQPLTIGRFREILREETSALEQDRASPQGDLSEAVSLFDQMVTSNVFVEHLTSFAYDRLTASHDSRGVD